MGIQISSRALGRALAPAVPGWAAGLPSDSIAARSPGAIRDSPTSSMSTANRTGAFGPGGGRCGGPPAAAPPPPTAPAAPAEPEPPGDAETLVVGDGESE